MELDFDFKRWEEFQKQRAVTRYAFETVGLTKRTLHSMEQAALSEHDGRPEAAEAWRKSAGYGGL